MSIEAMKQLIELYDKHCYNNDYGGIEFNKKHGYKFIESIEALRTAIQQAESEPVYWEWRHQGSHPDAVDFGQWSEWKRVEPRSALHTVEDALNEFRGYIARGHKYELRALYTHPAPGVPDGWSIEEKCGDLIVRKNGFGGYSAKKNNESIAEAVLHELALDLLAASPAQKGGE